ncbi:MAG: peptidyl-prolyl cis-trans isomerase, partial [Planctomycetota bacterium]
MRRHISSPVRCPGALAFGSFLPPLSVVAAFLFMTGHVETARGSEWRLKNAVVTLVNGTPIRKNEIELRAGQYGADLLQKTGEKELTREEMETVARSALKDLVRSRLIRQEAIVQRIAVGQEEIDEALKKKGETVTASAKEKTRDDLIFDEIMYKQGKPILVPSPREMRDFFQGHQDFFQFPRLVRARHITLPKSTEDLYESERRAAERIRAEIQDSGGNFAEVAARRAPNEKDRETKGLLAPPFVSRPDGMIPVTHPFLAKIYPEAFYLALQILKKGEVSPVVESPNAFHILYVEDEVPAKAV